MKHARTRLSSSPAKSLLTIASTSLFLAFVGCKTDGNESSAEKDVSANGKSGSGKSEINLDFYPIKNGQIQMERCVRQFGTSNKECKTYCTDASTLENKLRRDGVSDTTSIMRAISAPGDKDFGEDFKSLQSALLSLAESGGAQGCSDQNPFHAPQGVTKQTSQARRASGMEIADSYTLMPNGDFFREVNGLKCQITNRVADFKVSQHPNDAALAYFIKAGDLYVVNSSAEPADGQCPKTKAKAIMSNVGTDEGKIAYWVTSNTNTTVVNSAKDVNGKFVAWDNNRPVYSTTGIVDVDMNQCFGVAGKGFSSYVAFLLTESRSVIKIKGNPSDKDFSKEDSGSYSSLDAFRSEYNVCN